jgi:dynein assembly factor 3
VTDLLATLLYLTAALVSLIAQCFCLLQVSPYDCRHTLATIASWACSSHLQCQLQLHVYEEHPEALARHILLLYMLLDSSLPTRDRAEMFLEIFGNTMLREKTFTYLGEQS